MMLLWCLFLHPFQTTHDSNIAVQLGKVTMISLSLVSLLFLWTRRWKVGRLRIVTRKISGECSQWGNVMVFAISFWVLSWYLSEALRGLCRCEGATTCQVSVPEGAPHSFLDTFHFVVSSNVLQTKAGLTLESKSKRLGSKTLLKGPRLEDWFLKLGGVFSWLGTMEIWWESDATVAPLHFFIPWTGS